MASSSAEPKRWPYERRSLRSSCRPGDCQYAFLRRSFGDCGARGLRPRVGKTPGGSTRGTGRVGCGALDGIQAEGALGLNHGRPEWMNIMPNLERIIPVLTYQDI